MTQEEKSLRACWWSLIGLVICMVLCMLFASCTTTKVVTVERVKTDTLIQTKVQKDSIWLHDSITVSEKGDAIRIEKWHTKYIEKQVHDTTYISKTDSIPYPVEVIKEVPRQRGWLEKTLLGVGGMALMALIVGIAVRVKKYLPGQ